MLFMLYKIQNLKMLYITFRIELFHLKNRIFDIPFTRPHTKEKSNQHINFKAKFQRSNSHSNDIISAKRDNVIGRNLLK